MALSRRQFLGAASGAAALAVLPPSRAAGAGDPLGVRQDFPAASDGTFLNSAYIGPVPLPVARAGRAFTEAKSTKPVPLADMLAKRDEVRQQFARLVKATPDEIAFLFATSDGENIVTRSLGLKAGDNVVIDTAIYQLGAALSYLDAVGVDRIEAHAVPLAAQLRKGLVDRGFKMLTPPDNRSSVVSFVGTKDLETSRRIFDDAKVQVTVRENGAQIRVAAALFNTAADIERFLEVAEKLRVRS